MKKKIIVVLAAVAFTAFFFNCGLDLNGRPPGTDGISGSPLFAAAENILPLFPSEGASRAVANWSRGWPIFEMYKTFEEYDPAANDGAIGMDNIYKLLYQCDSFFTQCLNDGENIGDRKLVSPYYFGRTDNTYDTFLTRESAGRADYFAVKRSGTFDYGLLSWYREYSDGRTERGVMQSRLDQASGALDLDIVGFLEQGSSLYAKRMRLEGNTNTHRFTKLVIGKWNSGATGYRAWLVGSGVSRGAGNTFLFKIMDNNGLSAPRYFEFPADAGLAELQAMDDAGAATTASPYGAEVDAIVGAGEYFDAIADAPADSELPTAATHFHGTGLGGMKPVEETEIEGAWYGISYDLYIRGNAFRLQSKAGVFWMSGDLNIDTSADPDILDLVCTASHEPSMIGVLPGIFRIEGGVLLVKMTMPGLERPSDFSLVNGFLCAFGRDPASPPEVPGAYAYAPLEFFYANPNDCWKIHAYGLQHWGGPDSPPHEGLDVKVKDFTLTRSTVVSPVTGVVTLINENVFTDPKGYGLIMVGVNIFINSEYSCSLAFEPVDTIDLMEEQRAAIAVTVGQEVHAGDVIGDVLVGRYSSTGSYAAAGVHINLTRFGQPVCPYHNSSTAARAIYDAIIAEFGDVCSLYNGKICNCEE